MGTIVSKTKDEERVPENLPEARLSTEGETQNKEVQPTVAPKQKPTDQEHVIDPEADKPEEPEEQEKIEGKVEEEDEEEEEDEDDDEDEEVELEDLDEYQSADDEEDNSDLENEKEKEYMPPKELAQKLLNGVINIDLPSQVRIVRIFTSSTFTDTFNERNELMVKVYPPLKEFCQSLGYDFQVVDMRWGVRDEATTDHMTTELCMKELKACQGLSTGPSFVTFLSHKYGYRPFPPKIRARKFDALLKAVTSKKGKKLLTEWFLKDENTIPPTCILQSITDLLPNYNNPAVSPEERSKASKEWWSAFEKMQDVLRKAASKIFAKKPNSKWKYFMSVTENEIQQGIIKAKDPSKHCYWFKRNIYDLKDNVDDKMARNFIDKQGAELDTEANNLLNELKDNKIPNVLEKENISVYDIKWIVDAGVDPKASKQHEGYLDLLCRDFYRTLKGMIENGIQERQASATIDDTLIKEICQHVTTCQQKSRIFHGREDVIERIQAYLAEETEFNIPLVVHGESGCGKTSVIAKAATVAKAKFPDHLQVTRFIGTTSDSSTISKLLYSVCSQILQATGKLLDTIPQTYKKLSEFMIELFNKLRDEEAAKCIIFLDSIDQLAPDDGPFMMKWLPRQLPACIKIVISTLPEEKYQILPNLKVNIPDESFVEIPKLPDDAANIILNAWLSDAKRQLTPAQNTAVMAAFQHCPLPLFLKLSFDQAVKWKSYTSVETQTPALQENIKDSINKLFSDLERLHGKFLVSHALGLITVSKHGLSDAELDDLLSIDDEVLNDVYQYWTPPARRVPPLLWIRLRNDLGSYIVYRGASGVLVNTWYHRQFIETATERYVNNNQERLKYHLTLMEYFRGVWSNGRKKPFTTKSGEKSEMNRLVAAQPNIYKNKDGNEETYNYRRLSELPRHMIRVGALDILKKEVLLNFDFLLAKLNAFGYRHLIEDCLEASQKFPKDKEIKLIHDFMKMSSHSLLDDPNQLSCQLIGRLYDHHYNTYKFISTLLGRAKKANVPCFYPNRRCFDAPGGSLLHSLTGQAGNINHVTFSQDGTRLFSAGDDSTVRIWDLNTGFQLRSLEQEMAINAVFTYCNDTCAMLVSYASVIAQNLISEEVYYNEYHSSTYGKSSDMSPNKQYFLVSNGDEVLLFHTAEETPVLLKKIEEKTEQNSSGFMDIVGAGNEFFAYTRGKTTEIVIDKYASQDSRKTVTPLNPLIMFSFTPDGGCIVVLTLPATESTYKQAVIFIYDAQSGNVMKKFEGKDRHTVMICYDASVAKTTTGLEFIWPTIYQINFWNIENGQERTTLKTSYQGNTHKNAVCGGGDKLAVVSMAQNNAPLQVHELEAMKFVVIGDEHAQRTDIELTQDYLGEGDREMYLSPTDPNLCISITPMDPFLKVWDIKKQCMVKRITHTGIFATAVRVLDDHRVMLWEYNKSAVYVIEMLEGRIICNTSGAKLPEIAPSTYINCWTHIKETDELLIFDKTQKKFNIFSLETGKSVGIIHTGWKHKGSHLISSVDGSVIVSAEVNQDNWEESSPLCVYDTIARKKICQLKQPKRFDLRPEVAVLSEDSNYLFTINEDTTKVKVWNPRNGIRVTEIEYAEEDVASASIMALCGTSVGGFLVVCYSATVIRGEDYVQEWTLVFYELDTWKYLLQLPAAGMVSSFRLSHDATRILTDTRPGGGTTKTLELFELSRLKSDNEVTKIASLKLETDARFSYLSSDGKFVCVGLAGIDGITFFQPCGLVPSADQQHLKQQQQRQPVQIIELNINVESEC